LRAKSSRAKRTSKAEATSSIKCTKKATREMRRPKRWRNKIKDLENKSIDLENKQFEFNTKFESFSLNYQMQNRFVSGVKDRVEEMEETIEKFDAVIKEIQAQVKQNTSEHNDDKRKKSADSPNDVVTMQIFEKLQERVTGNDSLIDGLISKVKKLSNEVKDKEPSKKTPAFSNSSDPKNIDDRIKNLERMITKLSDESSSKPRGSRQDKNSTLDSDIENKVKHIEKEIDDLKANVPNNMSWQQALNSKADLDQRKKLIKSLPTNLMIV